MDGQRSFDDYRMPDELWEQMEEFLPDYPSSPKGGRPRADLRRIADAIFYRLRTGCQWNAIPPELAPGSTAHGRRLRCQIPINHLLNRSLRSSATDRITVVVFAALGL
jgi:transposase